MINSTLQGLFSTFKVMPTTFYLFYQEFVQNFVCHNRQTLYFESNLFCMLITLFCFFLERTYTLILFFQEKVLFSLITVYLFRLV